MNPLKKRKRSRDKNLKKALELHLLSIKKCRCCNSFIFKPVRNGNGFCNGKCQSRWRRDSGIDDEIRKCKFCAKEFKVNKYSKTITCGRSCGNYIKKSPQPKLGAP